ncbi:YbaN family protein [Pseudemcibacter aquimaris]|uniref:YbaN family protein n=1 Tax=Pseudemcibacter aquimaris TaxID=2857064 RepID=UPI00201362A1|nr:YbaN family protein [Pseudemcibacter aquimaris]MCC3859731.1 YbaN family protein [Pseudemcibacter aquimaris]WDU60125.1 YbaN family protein [Pseudemcibacter aquimaris]
MKEKTKRILYLIFGWAMFFLGFIGAFLPVLPTTPLMILALWGFSNGSETLHNWLYNHPKFGPSLQDWDKYRVIPIKAKLTAVAMISFSASYLIFFSNIPDIALIVSLGLMIFGVTYVLSRKSHRPPGANDDPSEAP